MKIILRQHEELIGERTLLMLEAERLLAKITKLNTRYYTKIHNLRKKIQKIEEHL